MYHSVWCIYDTVCGVCDGRTHTSYFLTYYTQHETSWLRYRNCSPDHAWSNMSHKTSIITPPSPEWILVYISFLYNVPSWGGGIHPPTTANDVWEFNGEGVRTPGWGWGGNAVGCLHESVCGEPRAGDVLVHICMFHISADGHPRLLLTRLDQPSILSLFPLLHVVYNLWQCCSTEPGVRPSAGSASQHRPSAR